MDSKLMDVIYLGFILPALFAISLVAEGIYRMIRLEDRREEGVFNVLLGTMVLVVLIIIYLFLSRK